MDSKGKRQYYRFLGNSDGSGCPYGIVFKCYTDEEYEYYKQFYRLLPETKREDKHIGIARAKKSLAIASLVCGISRLGYAITEDRL